MAKKKSTPLIDQDRKDAMVWAVEWKIRRKNRRLLFAGITILVIAALAVGIDFLTIYMTRSTYPSEEAMRAALQGRYETDYIEDIEIAGDDLTLTYYEISHYDPEYAEKYGYSDYGDSVYEDVVEKWDYRRGVIKGRWMHKIIVDKDGNLIYYDCVFNKSDDPKPVPFDPAILNGSPGDDESAEVNGEAEEPELTDEETEEAREASEESQEKTAEDEANAPADDDSAGAD